VPPQKVQEFLDPLPVRRLHGVGPATERALAELGIETVAQLRALPEERLAERFGRQGRILFEFARGIDDRPVETLSVRKSLGTESTYAVDLVGREAVEVEIDRLADELAESLRRRELGGCTLTLKLRYADFTTLTRSRTFVHPLDAAGAIAACARDLLDKTEAHVRPVRLLGLTASNLVEHPLSQLALFLAETSPDSR